MGADKEILDRFSLALDDVKSGPAKREKTREDLIEAAQEKFGDLLEFVTKLDIQIREKLGGNAGVVLGFGDFDEERDLLGAFITITPMESDRQNLIILMNFHGDLVQFDNPAFKTVSGSTVYGIENIDDAKAKLAGVVLAWLKNR
jgi:hypothetical protein